MGTSIHVPANHIGGESSLCLPLKQAPMAPRLTLGFRCMQESTAYTASLDFKKNATLHSSQCDGNLAGG